MILREALRGVIAVVRSDAATTRNYDTANICNGFALDLENLLAQTTDEPCPNCAELRAALAERDAKIRELDAWLTEKGEQQSDQFGNYGDSYCEGKADAYDAAGTKLRRLGLITEEQP